MGGTKEITVDVALPEQLQRQLDQADALAAELYGQPETLDQPVVENTPEPPAAPVVEPAPVEQPVEVVAPVEPAPLVNDAQWEQRYNVLRGKFEAEVPRLHTQIRELQEELRTVKQRQETPPPAPEPATHVTKADEETFGADLVDAMRRAAREEVERVRRELDQKVDNAVKPVVDRVARNDVDRFWGAVDSRVPDFDAINNDPRWIQYLNGRITGTAMTRRVAAQAAIDACDSVALIEIVEDWKRSVAPAATPQAPAARQVPVELQQQVAPSSRRDTAPVAPQGRVWTAAEYEAALDPRNRQRMTRTEADALVADAEAALAEGRVRW